MRRLAASLLSFSKGKWIFSAGILLAATPLIAGPVLHERFEPKPDEDLRLGATTASGSMPAALQTRSGVIPAPDETDVRIPGQVGPSYGGAKTQSSADANYYIDRMTTRPDRVKYDEPFRPSILPFKRVYAFDWVKEDLSLGVGDTSLSRISVGGVAESSEDAFFADFDVDLVADVPVRIPSVGPGARVRAIHTDPPVQLELVEDGAENWFARSSHAGRVRMVMQLSISREVFGSQFRNVSWEALAPSVSAVPERLVPVVEEVLRHIGVDADASPTRVLHTLVQYFRRFRESSELPQSVDALELYRELSFSQKGVCRHRAFAFLLTALGAGLPARLVHNEAHAWVEVHDSFIWHRIDLGGAASNIDETHSDPLLPDHRPPGDPHSWPAHSRSATEEARRPNVIPPALPASSQEEPNAESSPVAAASSTPSRPSGGDLSANSQPNVVAPVREPAEVRLRVKEKEIQRGRPLSVQGAASRGGRPCALSRVDIFVLDGENWTAIGSVATDRSGEFSGSVTLPQITPVGALQVTARLAGGCID